MSCSIIADPHDQCTVCAQTTDLSDITLERGSVANMVDGCFLQGDLNKTDIVTSLGLIQSSKLNQESRLSLSCTQDAPRKEWKIYATRPHNNLIIILAFVYRSSSDCTSRSSPCKQTHLPDTGLPAEMQWSLPLCWHCWCPKHCQSRQRSRKGKGRQLEGQGKGQVWPEPVDLHWET